MKHIVTATLGAFALLAGPAMAGEMNWKPEKPITIIVPWGAGGATDQVTRVTAGDLEEALGQKIVVVNQPGASGSIGKRNAWEAPRDGYTWAAGAPKQLGTYKLLGLLDTWIEDWELYLTVTNIPVVSVNPDTPYQDMGALLAAMKSGTVSVATAGAGSSGHAAMEGIKGATGVDYKHVTYDGGNPAVIATVAGETEVTTQLASEQAEMIRGGRLRPLAVVGGQPLEIEGFGTVPPITDFTDGDIPVLSTGFGIFLPKADTPSEVIETFNTIWDDKIANSEALKAYAHARGALFTPLRGDAALKAVWPEVQADAWSFHSAGQTKMSPEELNIPKP